MSINNVIIGSIYCLTVLSYCPVYAQTSIAEEQCAQKLYEAVQRMNEVISNLDNPPKEVLEDCKKCGSTAPKLYKKAGEIAREKGDMEIAKICNFAAEQKGKNIIQRHPYAAGISALVIGFVIGRNV